MQKHSILDNKGYIYKRSQGAGASVDYKALGGVSHAIDERLLIATVQAVREVEAEYKRHLPKARIA